VAFRLDTPATTCSEPALPGRTLIGPTTACVSLSFPKNSNVLRALLTLLEYSVISMRAMRDVFPSSMPRNAAPSSIEIPISVFGDAQAIPVQRLAPDQEYSYNSQVVPSTMNEPPTVTTRNSPTYVATGERSDITARYTPSNLGHGPYNPTTFTQPQSHAVDESPPDSNSDYFLPSVPAGIDQFRSHPRENIPPSDDYTYTNSFRSSMFGRSQDINTGDSLPYQDEIYSMPPSAEAFPSNIDPRLCLPMASPSP
jgi:hypothetical protein